MKMFISMVIVFLMASSHIYCQRGGISVGLGPVFGGAVSNNNFNYYYKLGIGGALNVNYGLTKLGSITTSLFFLQIPGKRSGINRISLTMSKIGYRTNFSDSKFFIVADAGIAQYGSTIFNGTAKFVAGGSMGYSFKFSAREYLDIFPSYSVIFRTPLNSKWLTGNFIYRIYLKNKRR